MISTQTLLLLAIPVALACVLSLFNQPQIRRFRNLGILATYVAAIFSAIRVGVASTVVAWVALGLFSGMLYFLFERWSAARTDDSEGSRSAISIIHGLIAWPVMLPEIVEYSLAEAGILGSSSSSLGNGDSGDDPNS